MFATLYYVQSNPITFSRPQRRLLLASVTIGGVMLALLSLVESAPAHAQTVRISDDGTAPALVRDPVETIALRITAAHRIATDNADALVHYVATHRPELDRAALTTQSDAIGHSLDRAVAATVELAAAVTRSEDRRRVVALQKRDEAARNAHTTLVDTLANVSVSVQQVESITKDLNVQVHAGEREVTALCAGLELSCGGNLLRTASR